MASASLSAGVTSGSNSITLLGQSPWVSDRQDFRLRLQIAAHDPAHEQLRVVAYNRLTTRTAFDDALSGHIDGYAVYGTAPLDLSTLPPDADGGVDVDIPINKSATSPGIETFYAAAGSAVFPIQVQLYQSGDPVGQPLTTYLVYAEPFSASGLPKLSVSITLPVHAAPALDGQGQRARLSADASGDLAGLVDVLDAHPGLRLSLEVTPQTLAALAAPSASTVDHTTLDSLVRLVRGGRIQVLPKTYVSVPLRGWTEAGLGSELNLQLNAGSSVLAGVFGTAPSPATWVINGSLDTATLETLVSRGATRFILPDAELSPLPAIARENTLALPTSLLGAGTKAVAYGADPGLTADFSNPGGPVLAANQLLAEMAMIQLEQPGDVRGVAVLPPPGWNADPTFIDTLLSGLEGHPLLTTVSATGLFAAAPLAPLLRSVVAPQPPSSTSASGAIASTGPGTTGASTTVTTVSPALSADIANQLGPGDPASILSARHGLAAIAAILPDDAPMADTLGQELLTAESSDVTEAQRLNVLGAISKATNGLTNLITLPHSSSITLTSTRGQIPLTVLSATRLHVRVELRLSSERLIFHLFYPSDGKCRLPTQTSEICDLILTTQNTTLKVPVETRSSGVFPLQVSLYAPGGSLLLKADSDTVRSTAVSGVGVVLIVVAVVFLAAWWVRDARHGRRARELVPAPDNEADDRGGDPTPGGGASGNAAEAPGDSDPVVRQFFSTPAPEYEDRPAQPRP